MNTCKYLIFFIMFTLLGAYNAYAQPTKKARWFEVEVILFQQLGDKSKLREQFPENTSSAAKQLDNKNYIELLEPFLKPNIHTLKSLLPYCDAPDESLNFIEQSVHSIKLTPLFENKNLSEIKLLSNTEETNTEETNAEETDIGNSNDTYPEEDHLSTTASINDQQASQAIINNANIDYADNQNTDEIPPLSAQMQALVAQAEQTFSPYQFNIKVDFLPPKKNNRYKNVGLCQLPQTVIKQLQQHDSQFNADYFSVDKVPTVINGAEYIYSNKPYLLNKDSLKLNDIVKRLRWSKEFRPLLHLGWRLAPKGRNYAIPLHLFAGDNLQAHYQQQLEAYNQAIANALKQEKAQEQAQNQLQEKGHEPTPELTPEQQKTQRVNTQLTRIIEQLMTFVQNTAPVPTFENLIQQLDNQTLSLQINDKISQLEQKYQITKPQPPLQQWFLDGWFKVHLNHYLFITADLTVMNKTLAQQASEQLTPHSTPLNEPLKLIEFKQDRRVISKEIHYFDHPYIGMIVQIRRYKRPTPPVEDDEFKNELNPTAITKTP